MTHRSGPDLDGLDDWTGPPLVRPRGAIRYEIRSTLFGIPVGFVQAAPPDRILVVQEGGCFDVPVAGVGIPPDVEAWAVTRVGHPDVPPCDPHDWYRIGDERFCRSCREAQACGWAPIAQGIH